MFQPSLCQEIVIQIGGEIVSGGGSPTQRFTVTHLLDIAQAASDTSVSIGVECVEIDGHPGITARVDFVAVQNRLDGAVDDLRRSGAVGVDEIGTLVGLVLAFHIAVSQGEFQGGLVGNLTAELSGTFLDGGIHSSIDRGDGLGVALGDDQRNGILGVAAIDTGRFPDIGVGQADDTGDDLGGCFLSSRHIFIPPLEEQLAFIAGIHTKVTELMKQYHRVVVTGDHGTSRLAARFFHTKDGMIAPQDSTVCIHGRYCKLAQGTSFVIPNVKTFKRADGVQYAVYTNYDHFKQPGFAAGADDDDPIYGEVHGGATPEELLVPVVVIDSNTDIPLTAQWEKTTVKIAMKKARLNLTFNKPVFNLQVKVAEIDGIVTASEDGMKWNVVLPGIKPGPYAPHIVANNMIVLTEDITIKPALGGDGDLP